MADQVPHRSLAVRLTSGFAKISEGHRVVPVGPLGAVVTAVSLVLTAYLMWYALWGLSNRHLLGSLFLLAILPMIFVTTSASKAIERITVWDYALAAVSVALAGYFVANRDFYYDIIEGITPISGLEKSISILLVAISVEACRRTIGWGLTAVVVVLLLYVMFGHLLEGGLHHDVIDLEYFVTMQTVTQNGIFGVPLQVAATYAFLFMLFGSLYQRAGGGQLFFDLAAAVAGRSVGGPAKASVVSSGLYGSISGSPVADVVTTGPITIPLMMRVGIPARRAGAIEAAASAGGALLPPVMGSAAFLMVEFTGISYDQIIKAGVFAGLLYYFGVFLLIHFEARRFNDGRIAEEDLVTLAGALRRGWFHLLPIAALIYFLVAGYTPTYVAAGSSAFVVAISWLNPNPSDRLGPSALAASCRDTVFRMAVLAGAVLAAGIIIGCIELTGLTGKFTLMMFYLAGDVLMLALAATAVVLILLGMGMPTQGVYIMGVALLAPVLVLDYKFDVLPTHMFLLYFSSLSAITPPLAVACFAAGTIAGANPMSIAFYAVKLGIAGFILPFFFIFNPGLLLVGSALDVLSAVSIGIVLVIASMIAVHGWIGQQPLAAWQRIAFAALAAAMVAPLPVVQYPAAVVALVALAALQIVQRAHAERRAS